MGKLLKAIHSLYIFTFIHIKTTQNTKSNFGSTCLQAKAYIALKKYPEGSSHGYLYRKVEIA